MSDKTTDTLIRMMQATFDAAPAAPSLSTRPSRQPARYQSLLVATGAFVVALLVVGAGILLLRPAGSSSGEVAAPPGTQPPAVSDTIPPSASEVVVPPGPPHLVLDAPDTRVVDAYNIFDEATGLPVGLHTTYHMTLTNDPEGWTGREILLRLQQEDASFPRFDELIGLAESTRTVGVDGRVVTVYMVPDEAIEEGSYDQGVLQWEESPGYEAILIPWGMGPDEALTLIAHLKIVSDYEWDQLTNTDYDSSVTVETTPSNDLVSLMPRLTIDLPGFEIVDGTEGKVGPAHWFGEWNIRIGDTTGVILLDSAQTVPSETFIEYDTPQPVDIAGVTGLLVGHDDGFIVEWEDLDTRFTIAISGTQVDPSALIKAITYIDEATWRQLLPDTTE